jgi:hypothetical protein
MAFNEALHELFSFICMNNQCYLKELQVMYHRSSRVFFFKFIVLLLVFYFSSLEFG